MSISLIRQRPAMARAKLAARRLMPPACQLRQSEQILGDRRKVNAQSSLASPLSLVWRRAATLLIHPKAASIRSPIETLRIIKLAATCG